MLIRLLAWIVLACNLAGCRQVQDTAALSREMSAALNEPEVKVQLDSEGSLTVMLPNSPVAGQSDDERNVHCKRVAEFVRDHYSGYGELERINVAFATPWSPDSAITSRAMFCMFTAEKLGAPGAAGVAPVDAN